MKDELLKFITCGSVDDGKSTLIGHCLQTRRRLWNWIQRLVRGMEILIIPCC